MALTEELEESMEDFDSSSSSSTSSRDCSYISLPLFSLY